mgnify:CR=1 FL=1
MYSGVSGKNIMQRFDLIRSLTPILFSSLLLILSCSAKKDSESNTDTVAVTDSTALTEDDKIEQIMNEAMGRLRDKDKSFLYENEFAYYREKFSFDDYLKERKISAAQADTLVHIDVKTVTYFGRDSAKVDVDVHFKGPSGKETVLQEKGVALYWHQGRWIKPTLSNVVAQREYDDIIEKARSASESEKQGSGK